MFSTRIPGEKRDSSYFPFPNIPKHIILLINDQMFILNVLDTNNEILPLLELIK